MLSPTKTIRFIEDSCKATQLEISNKKLKRILENDESTIRIDSIFNNKRVIKKMDSINIGRLQQIIEEMKQLSNIKKQEFFLEFPKVEINIIETIKDKKLELITIKEIIDMGIAINKEILLDKTVKSIQSFWEINNSKTKYIAENFDYSEKNTNIGFGIDLSIKDKTPSSVFISKIFFKKEDINIGAILEEIKEEMDICKDPIEFKGNAKEYNLFFSPYALRQIVNYFVVQQSSLESFEKKDSYLMHTKFDTKINICEDPFVDYSPYSEIMDLDFIATKKKHIIKNGKVLEYITNEQDAFKYKKEPSGNNLPGGVTNLFFESGQKSKEELLYTGKILFINNLIGIHTTNSKEGSLNLSASGAEYENGKRINALKNIKLNEKIQDLWKKVEISKETKWVGNYNLPYLLCLRN